MPSSNSGLLFVGFIVIVVLCKEKTRGEEIRIKK
jgi:hypothetical protein